MRIFSIETQNVRDLRIDKRCAGPSWSPDGRFVACIDGDISSGNLWLFPLSGEGPIAVTGNAREPKWSAEGRRLFFVTERSGSRDLWLQELESDGSPSGAPVSITSGLVMRRFAFSPDGALIAFTSGRSGNRASGRFPLRVALPARSPPIQRGIISLTGFPTARRSRSSPVEKARTYGSSGSKVGSHDD